MAGSSDMTDPRSQQQLQGDHCDKIAAPRPTEHNLDVGIPVEHHNLYIELKVLSGDQDHVKWKVAARWLKFLEVLEPDGQKWSKPHVSTLPMQSLFRLKAHVPTMVTLFDLHASELSEVTDAVLNEMVSSDVFDQYTRRAVFSVLSQMQGGFDSSDRPRDASPVGVTLRSRIVTKVSRFWKEHRKILENSELCEVLVGELDVLTRPVVGFVRLADGIVIQDLATNVVIPVRFLFILLGPSGNKNLYLDIGRAFATLMNDEEFCKVAYKATGREDLLVGLDSFLDMLTVIPRSQWDPATRIEPPPSVPGASNANQFKSVDDKPRFHKIPFAGLVSDIKRRYRWYWKDIRDGLNIQIIASIIFIFFANVTHATTFGGVLYSFTEEHFGPLESILAVGIGNFIFSLFAGQPLILLGVSGATLVFEKLVYSFCDQQHIPFFNFRFWIGFWSLIFATIGTAFNVSGVIRIFTRFSQDLYTCLVAFMFMYDAIEKLFTLETAEVDSIRWETCWNTTLNTTTFLSDLSSCTGNTTWILVNDLASCRDRNVSSAISYVNPGILLQSTIDRCSVGIPLHNMTEVVSSGAYVMSFVLFIGAFLTAFYLRRFRDGNLCTDLVRRYVSLFAIPISVVIWVSVDQLVGYQTKKVDIPNVLEGDHMLAKGRSARNLLIHPMGNGLPVWAVFAAIIPGFAITFITFMATQITSLVVNRADNKLKKGGGYHLDFFVVGVVGFVCCMLGLPFVTGAIIRTITHVQSLHVIISSDVPGEKPKLKGVIEQRISSFGLGVLASISIIAYPVFRLFPMGLLYAVFFFVGTTALFGVQFLDRLFLFITPTKYWPDYKYLRNVRNRTMYLYTAIQLSVLVFICIFKAVPDLNLLFPVVIVLLGTGRYLLGFIFTSRELELMDNPIPEKLYPQCVKRVRREGVVYKKNKTPEVELVPLIIPERS